MKETERVDDRTGKTDRTSVLGGKRRSFLKFAGGGLGLSAIGVSAVGNVAADGHESCFQVDFVEGHDVLDPLDADGYSGRGRLINWIWGDEAGNTAEGDLDYEPYDTGDTTVETADGITLDLERGEASVTYLINQEWPVDLALVAYEAPCNGALGWNPERADRQTVYDVSTVTDSAMGSLTVDVPPGPSLSEGLVGHWSFGADDVEGDTVADRSGNGNDGTIVGDVGTDLAAPVGVAAEFDGSTEEETITVAHDDQIDPPEYTASAWLQTDDTGGWSVLVGKAGSMWCGTTGPDGTRTRFDINDDGGSVLENTDVQIDDGAWHHVVYRHAENDTRIYVDTQLDDSGDVGGASSSSGDDLAIGSKSGLGDWFTGLLADVRLYDRPLSEAEIEKLYQQGAAA